MNRKLEGRVALVTGGSSGIGLATAERFVAEGAFVYITGRRQAQLDTAVKKIGSNVKGVQADVSKPADLDRLYAQIKKEKGRLDTVPAFSVYSAAKAAVRNLARGWATDLKDRGIRINAVSPGVVITPAYEKLGLSDEQIKSFAAQMVALIPLGRTGEPDEIAKAVLFLASDDSSFVNGAELVVDGGQTQV